MKVYQNVNHIARGYESNKDGAFNRLIAQTIEDNQKKGWVSEVQYSTCASKGTLVFSALILAYTEE